MKKRIFIQNSIFWQLTCLLLLVAFCVAAFNFVAFIVAFVGMSLAGVNEYPLYMWIFTEILWLIGTIMCPYEFINMESYTIFLDGNRVWMNGEIRPKEFKTQYKASVQLNEIREVSFVRTNRNSRNKSIKTGIRNKTIPCFQESQWERGMDERFPLHGRLSGKNIGRTYFKNNEFFQCL